MPIVTTEQLVRPALSYGEENPPIQEFLVARKKVWVPALLFDQEFKDEADAPK